MASATIQRIKDIQPIPDADKIELATVMGWQLVTAKENNFKANDFVIYVEIDSITEDRPEYEFLRDRNFRIKTIKLRGQISQGLILPVSLLGDAWIDYTENGIDMLYPVGNGLWANVPYPHYNEGDDVSEILGIKHYEKPLPLELSGMAIGSFPSFLSRTDEDMVQSCLRKLDALQGKPYYITVKVDGMSATFYKWEERFGVCSRNLELKEHENNVFWKLAHKYSLETIKDGIYLQGEVAGPGIQKNKLGLKEPDLFIFNVKHIQGNKQISFTEMVQTLEYPGKCKMVPVLASGDNFSLKLNDLIELANHVKYDNGAAAEGIVVRSQDGLISFKCMNNNYLLKNGE